MKMKSIFTFFFIEFIAFSLTCCGEKETCGVLEGSANITSSQDVSIFACYTEITGDLIVNEPRGLTSFDLSNLTSIGGDLAIVFNYKLTRFGLNGLESVGGNIEIQGNDLLANMDGLSRLNFVGGNVVIGGDKAIMDKNFGNVDLENIDGLSNLQTVGGNVTIENNPNLPTCAAEALVEQLVDFTGNVYISGNDDFVTCD